MENKKKKKRNLLIALIIVLALAAVVGAWYYRISTDPAGQFKNAPTPAPTSKGTTTVQPLIPIVRPTEAP